MKIWYKLLSIGFLGFSCTTRNTDTLNTWNKTVNDVVTYWSGREFILPDTFSFISNPNDTGYILNKTSNKKLIAFIDGTCSICMHNLVYWNDFIMELHKRGRNFIFLIFVYSPEKDEIIHKVQSIFNYPFIYTDNMDIIEINKIYDKRFQTVIVNEENKVILIGDPVMFRAELGQLYKDYLSVD